MKTLGTLLFAIVLTMSPVAIVSAQTAAQPPVAPVATESDLQKATAGLSKEIKRNTAELKAELAREAKAQADAQRAADKAAADKRDDDRKVELAREAKARADATKTRNMIIGTAFALLVVAFIAGLLVRRKRVVVEHVTVANVAPAKTPTPEDLYGQYPNPALVKKCLLENNLREGRFTIDLPDERLVFEYRAIVDSEGTVTARFAGNGDTKTALDHLRKTAKRLHGEGKLQPITLKPTVIHRVA